MKLNAGAIVFFCDRRYTLPPDVTRIGRVQISPSRLLATDPRRKVHLRTFIRFDGMEAKLAAPAVRVSLNYAYRITVFCITPS